MRSLWIAGVFLVGCTAPGGEEAFSQTTAFDGKVVLFGNLHAHSKLSDDIRNAADDMLPVRAFEYADEHGLDFLAITNHHKATDSTHRLFMARDEYAPGGALARLDSRAIWICGTPLDTVSSPRASGLQLIGKR